MALENDNRNGGFSFIWNIQYFSHFMENSNSIQSPSFVMNTFKEAKWNLCLQQEEIENEKFFTCNLRFSSEDVCLSVKVNVVVSVRETNGLFKTVKDEYYSFSNSHNLCFNLFKNGDNAYLDDDELTLRCRMWIDSSELSQSVRCYASTYGALKMSYLWEMKNFVKSETQHIPEYKVEIPSIISPLDIEVSSCSDEDSLYVVIKLDSTDTLNLITIKVSMLDADREVVFTRKYKHSVYEKRSWRLGIISIKELFEKKDLYLPHDTLSLLLEFVVLTGAESSEIKRVEYGTKCIKDSDSPSKAWVDNFQQLYSDGKFSDIIVRTANFKEFPAHKSILCAQSPVFSAMFDGDTKENQTGVVEIEDLDGDTLHKLLLFIYTGTVKDLDWEMAPQLYYAADKYGIAELIKKCVDFFKYVIDVSKVCDVLILADRHQDKALESIAKDFIVQHVEEIMTLDNWKKLMKDNPSLTSETMHFIISKKFKCGLSQEMELKSAASSHGSSIKLPTAASGTPSTSKERGHLLETAKVFNRPTETKAQDTKKNDVHVNAADPDVSVATNSKDAPVYKKTFKEGYLKRYFQVCPYCHCQISNAKIAVHVHFCSRGCGIPLPKEQETVHLQNCIGPRNVVEVQDIATSDGGKEALSNWADSGSLKTRNTKKKKKYQW